MNNISAKEASQRIDNDDFVVLDVREQFEIDAASVKDFIHIPMQQVPKSMDKLPKDKTIGVLCHTGGRSSRVTMYLNQQGFDNVVNISGGIEAWARLTDSDVPRYRKSFGQAQVIS